MRLKSRLLDIEEATIAGLNDFSYVDQAITSLKEQVEDLQSRNGQLETFVRQLRHLIINHPQGKLSDYLHPDSCTKANTNSRYHEEPYPDFARHRPTAHH